MKEKLKKLWYAMTKTQLKNIDKTISNIYSSKDRLVDVLVEIAEVFWLYVFF